MAHLAEHDNRIVVVDDPLPDYSEPIARALYWPTALWAKDFPHLVGVNVKMLHGCCMTLQNYSITINLLNGSQTTPVYQDATPIKPPKKRRDGRKWEWRRGEWRPE